MRELLQKKPWVAVALVVVALSLAVISGIRTFAPAKLLPPEQQIAEEKKTHDKLQQELQEKYGIKPVPYGAPGAPESPVKNGQVPN
jgi:hypothetical protein